MDLKKKFYAIPKDISKMTDEEIEAWVKNVYSDFVKSVNETNSRQSDPSS